MDYLGEHHTHPQTHTPTQDIAGAEALVAEQQAQGQRGGGKEEAKGSSHAMAAACFHLAQHLEGQEHDVLRAIEYYAKVCLVGNYCIHALEELI